MSAKTKRARSTSAAPASVRRWPGIWMNAAGLLVGVLTAVAVPRLFLSGADWQLGLIVGACVGLIASSLVWAPVAAVVAVATGLSIVLGSFDLAPISLPALIVAIVAPAVCWSVRRRPETRAWIAYAVIGLIVANMWATTVYVSFPWQPGGAAQFVATSPKVGESWLDTDFYRRVLWLMRGGKGYYEAYRQAFNENVKWGFDPPSVASYRLPTAFWFWTALPGGSVAMFVAWLVLSTGALVASVRIALHRVPVAFAIPAVAALSTYFVYNGTTTLVLLTEPWAAALGLLAVAAYIESFDSPSWRTWTVLAAGVALTACLVRELMVYLPVAGLLAALIAGGEQRRFRALAWSIALAVFAAAYASHVAAIGEAVSGVGAEKAFASGGFAFLTRAFFWGVKIVGGGGATVVTLSVLAVVGIVMLRERSERVFFALAVALPFCAFLLFGNDAVDSGGKATNYWGIVIVPLLIALSSWGFTALPDVGILKSHTVGRE
jgi:hypothetical protein